MTKQEKILSADTAKKALVLEILEKLNGESYNDSKEILDLAAHFLKENAYVDFELAKDRINNIIEGE